MRTVNTIFRALALTLALQWLVPHALHPVRAQGIPFIYNYKPTEYNGHKQNFDILTGDEGTIYVANFEGLLYFDNAEWRMIHTQGVNRITSLFRDSKGRIWTGGYNYLGYLSANDRGILSLAAIDENHTLHGEVNRIWEQEGVIRLQVSDGNIFSVSGNTLKMEKNAQVPDDATSPADKEQLVTQRLSLDDGFHVVATNGEGLYVETSKGDVLFQITEENGLCSNNITHIAYNGHGMLWGATDNGIFAIAIPSVYTHFGQNEGLRGEVLSIAILDRQLYVGTLNGLFIRQGKQFEPVGNITHACWQLDQQPGYLLAATANGTYRVTGAAHQQLTTQNTMAVKADGDGFYSGEMDGVYYNRGNQRQKISSAEKVVKILKDDEGALWLQNLYGRIWKSNDEHVLTRQTGDDSHEEVATLVYYHKHINIITADSQEPFPYPLFSYNDKEGYTWLTNNQGKCLYAMKDNSASNNMSTAVYPLMDYSVRTMLRDKDLLWMGGDQGLNVVDCSRKDPLALVEQKLHIRSIILNGDSILWGGYGTLPASLSLASDERHITFNYSVEYSSLLLPTQYRYRINNGRWSAWSTDTQAEFSNQTEGHYTLEVQARDAYGRLSEIAQVQFAIAAPLYLRWYMMLLYLLLAVLATYGLVRLRLRQLERDKHRLESIVQERTAEIVKLEKVAAVGKLTQGLIDRILNPLNYINNFSKLSQGLVKDVTANIEDEKDNMDEENYEDTMDVLGMLQGNLEKVSEHGASTTRTLKAMEEMLKDRSGGIVEMDLIPVIHQNEEMLRTYYEKDIANCHINIAFKLPVSTLPIKGNADQLSKTMMSLLGNAIYAVVKKYQRTPYSPEVTLAMTVADKQATISIRDNGIGIESTIIDKIFDPFFTTKTTGEASGTGLYLSKEILQNHGGDIQVESQKDTFTEFTITLPTL